LRLQGKIAVVTGGAGGIGAATASLLAAQGARVVVADIDGPGATAVADKIKAAGGEAIAIAGDMGREQDVRAMIDLAPSAFGGLDILFNNAAAIGPTQSLGLDGTVEQQDVAQWDHVMAVNLRGPMLASKYAIPLLRARGGGSIINTVSPAGWQAEPVHAAYGASKAGLILLTKHVACSHGPEGIRCNGIAPGLVVGENTAASLPPRWLDGRLRHTRSTRAGRPDDIAHTVLFLASPEAEYVNGIIIPVDGAYTAHNPYYAEHLELMASADTPEGLS
jgi:NAD(P)-dependent dehydrogenase (short-subunit alcohol dehydrogenase family)